MNVCAGGAGWVFGTVHQGMSSPRDQWTGAGFLREGAVGAIEGLVTHGLMGLAGRMAAPLIQRAAPRPASKLKGADGDSGKGGTSSGKGNAVAKAHVVSGMGRQGLLRTGFVPLQVTASPLTATCPL